MRDTHLPLLRRVFQKSMQPNIPVTVEILTRNSESTLRTALESVKSFKEILLLDADSTDKTLDIGKEYGAQVIQQDQRFLDDSGSIVDFSGVRNQGFERAGCDWFLFIDADEELSSELLHEIKEIVNEGEPAVYWIPRTYTIQGERVVCSASYPNKQMRLFHRSLVSHFRKPIHERLELKEGVVPRTLQHSILVPADLSAEEASVRKKMHKYIQMDLSRHEIFSFSTCMRVYVSAIRSLGRLTLKSISSLFCRGKRLSFAAESRPFIYQGILIKEATKKLFS